MKKLFIASGIALLLIANSVSAQSLRQVVRKTVVEPSRAAHGVAEDIAQDKAEEALSKAIMEGMGIEEDAKFEPEYLFTSWFQMQVTTYKKNGKVDDQQVYDTYVNDKTLDYGMEFLDKDTRSTILFDSSAFAMIILSDDDGEKAGFATKMSPDMLEGAMEEADDPDEFQPYKTGKTREILGYTCDEYLFEREDDEVRMWASEELGDEMRRDMLNNPNAFGTSFQYAWAVKGMILEYELIHTDDGQKLLMQVTDLDLNRKHSISTRDYQIVSMQLGN